MNTITTHQVNTTVIVRDWIEFQKQEQIHLKLARFGNNNLLGSLSRLGTKLFNGLDDGHAFGDAAKHNVLAIKP